MRFLVLLAIGCAADHASSEPVYLVFQHFTGAPIPDPSDPSGAHILIQGNTTVTDIVADDESYADQITTLVAVTLASGRRLGFAVGPLGLDLGPDLIAQTIQAGFEAARRISGT